MLLPVLYCPSTSTCVLCSSKLARSVLEPTLVYLLPIIIHNSAVQYVPYMYIKGLLTPWPSGVHKSLSMYYNIIHA